MQWTASQMTEFLKEYPDWKSKPINQEFWDAFSCYCSKQKKHVAQSQEGENN